LISLYFALPNQLQVHTFGHDLEKGQKHGLEQFPAGLPVILNEVEGADLPNKQSARETNQTMHNNSVCKYYSSRQRVGELAFPQLESEQ